MNYYWMHLVFALVVEAAGLADEMALGWHSGWVEGKVAMPMKGLEPTVSFGSTKLMAAHRFY